MTMLTPSLEICRHIPTEDSKTASGSLSLTALEVSSWLIVPKDQSILCVSCVSQKIYLSESTV